MKKAILVSVKSSLFLFILLLSNNLSSQEEFIFSTDNNSEFIEVREINDKYAALYYQSNELNEKWSGLMLFDEEFEYDTIEWKSDTANILFQDFIITEENNILLSGTIKSLDSIFTQSLIFLLLDEELNMLNETVIEIPFSIKHSTIRMMRTEQGRNFLTIYELVEVSSFYGFIELSDEGEVMQQSFYSGPGVQIAPFFSPQNDTSFFIYQLGFTTIQYEIVEVDDNLNYTITQLFDYSGGGFYNFGQRGSCKLVNDSTFLLATHRKNEDEKFDLCIYKMGTDFQLIGEPIIVGQEEHSEYALRRRTMDWKDADKIFIASRVVWDEAYSQKRAYYVAILNQDLEIIGAKIIIDEENKIDIQSLIANNSGGCTVLGTRVSEVSGEEYSEGYVAFFNTDDIITAASETPNPNDSDYLLFPNPGKELTIQTARKGVKLEIYDRAGTKVLESNFKDDFLNKVNTSSLAPGVYFCHFTDKYGYKEVKKWMKF